MTMGLLTSGVAVCMTLCLLLAVSAVVPDEEIDETVYIENGAASVTLSCGEVPTNSVAIEWFIKKDYAFEKILKFYYKTPNKSPQHTDSYTSDKYDINESVNTSLVVKNVELSDDGLFQCGTAGEQDGYSYMTKLQVVVPPEANYKPDFTRGDLRTNPPKDLAGPYLEHVNEDFTCDIRNVLPGKDSTVFKFYYDSSSRLRSNNIEQVEEISQLDQTKHVVWTFSTSFHRSDNGGKMRCIVNWKAGQYNKIGLRSDLTENVQVTFGATRLNLTESPQSLVEEENTATFKCLSDEGNPTPLIKWTRGQSTDEVKHGRFNAKVTESTMRVTVDKTINQEEISCYIEEDQAKRQQRREQKVILSVKFEATTIEMTKVPQVAIEEKNEAQYECETSSAYPEPPSVLWYVDDDPVGVNDEHTVENNPSSGDHHGQKTKSTLRLTTNREMNMKKVKCVLENDDTKFNEHSLNVTFKPNGLDIDIGEPVRENTKMSVECKANSANPASSVGMELFIDGAKQNNIASQVSETDGFNHGKVKTFVFKFTTDRNQNGKEVKCQLLWVQNNFKETKDTLNITYPPKVSVDNTASPAVEYTTRNIACRTSGGNPSDPGSYKYEWMYRPTYTSSDKDLDTPSGSSVINGGNTLQLKHIGYEKMAGTYKCTVTSIGGQNRGNGTLEVYYTAKSESTLADRTVYAALESAANLTVKFRMNPVNDRKVTWSMCDSELQDTKVSDTVEGEHVQTTYSISDVTKQQLGNYTVQVINKAITSEHNEEKFIVVLELRGSPEKPMEVTIVSKNQNSITVGWKAGLNGGSEQHFKILYREKGQGIWKESQDSVTGLKTGESANYTVKELDAAKEYEITVVAINQFNGRSESQADVQTVITEAGEDKVIKDSDEKAVADAKTNLIIGIICALVAVLVIAFVIVAVIVRRKKKKGPQDDSKGIERVENEYKPISRDSDLDPVEEMRREVEANKAKKNKKKPPVEKNSPVEDEGPVYAQPKKKTPNTQANNGTKANGSKGKSPNGKGKKSRPKPSGHAAPPPPGSDYQPGQTYENVELLSRPVAEDDEQVVYMNTNDAKKQDNQPPADGPTLVYADLTFQHIDPARQEAMPDTDDKLTYASVDFDLTKAYTLEDNE